MMETLKQAWDVQCVFATLEGGTRFEFYSRLKPGIITVQIKAPSEEEAWEILADTVKVSK